MVSKKGNMFKKSIVEKFQNEYNIRKKEDIDYVGRLADLVLGEFNKKGIADDDFVHPEIRDVLYQLEAMDLLKMDITEKHIIDGRVWKKHYWLLNYREAEKVTEGKLIREEEPRTSESYNIYSYLPDEIWDDHRERFFQGKEQ